MSKIITILTTTSLLITSCSPYFLRKTVIVNTNDGALIHVNERQIGYTNQRIRVNRANKNSTSLQIRKEGYKTKHAVIYKNKGNVGYYLGIFNPLILLTPYASITSIYELSGAGHSRNYGREWNYDLQKYPSVSDSIQLSSITRIEIDSTLKSKTYRYSSVRKWKKGNPYNSSYLNGLNRNSVGNQVLERHSESVSYNLMNHFLEDIQLKKEEDLEMLNYQDFQIRINVIRLDRHIITLPSENRMNYFDMEVQYSIKDKFGKQVFEKNISSLSDQFFIDTPIEKIFYDAMYYNFLKLLNENEVVKLLNSPKELSNSNLDKVFTNSINEREIEFDSLPTSALYIKQNGIRLVGLPVSNDGLVAFSKSAILYSDNLTVFNHAGDSVKAEKYLEIAPKEMAILKTNLKFENYFELDTAAVQIGEEAILTGFDRTFSTLLLSRGIVSGKRNQNQETVYQIDAEANYMIYPIVLSKEGKIKGFISRKLDSYEINSIAFFPSLKEY